jgi:hypothetical protein
MANTSATMSRGSWEGDIPVETSGNFLGRLFDLSFTSFITPMLVRALFILGLITALIIAVGAVAVAFFESGIWAGIWALIWAPVWLLVVAVVLRIWMEIAIVFFRIAQASIEIARNTQPPRA